MRDLKEDGYHGRIKINTDNVIVGGHSRKKALLKAGLNPSDEIEVLVPHRTLKEEEFRRINIKDNLSFGAWDYEVLGNAFDVPELIVWGFPEEYLGVGCSPDEKPEREERSKKSIECPSCGCIF